MLSTEQVLLRIGIDARSVVAGLNKTTSLVNAWGSNLVNQFKTNTGKFLVGLFSFQAAEAAFGRTIDYFNEIGDKVLAIKKESQDLGLSTNFVQNLFNTAQRVGVSYEKVREPLAKLNELIGAAKNGSVEATQKLFQFGLITDSTKVKSLNLRDALDNLRKQHNATADAAKNNYRESELLGKGFIALTPILQMTAEQMNALDRSNFFNTISPQAINLWTGLLGAKTTIGQAATATIANLFRKVAESGTMGGPLIGPIIRHITKVEEAKGAILNKEQAELDVQQQSIENEQKKVEILNRQNEMIQKQTELQSEILDRNKVSISEMADRVRKRLGIPDPQQLNMQISSRDMQALRIDTLEKQASVAFEQGRDQLFSNLTNEALTFRKGFAGGKYADVNPLARTEVELTNITSLLVPVKDMSNLVLKEHAKPQ